MSEQGFWRMRLIRRQAILKEANMSSHAIDAYGEIMERIRNFKPWRGPELAPGVQGFLHAPIKQKEARGNNNGLYLVPGIDCLCGGFHGKRYGLVSDWQDFLAHVEQKKQEATERGKQ